MVLDSESNDGVEYALKVLRNPGSLQARKRFRREIEAIQKVEHHSVIRVFDSSREQDCFQYYVMEFHKDARTLANIISCPSNNPFYSNVSLSLQLFEHIIEAIEACESSSKPIVHRDIKPQNVLVLNDNSIRLIDFGVCQIDDGSPITLTDENVGTLNYMAPECGAGNEDEITSQADIYSAAKVLWSAITSQQAFNRERQVFQNRSMKSMFPTKPNHWHLSAFIQTNRPRIALRPCPQRTRSLESHSGSSRPDSTRLSTP